MFKTKGESDPNSVIVADYILFLDVDGVLTTMASVIKEAADFRRKKSKTRSRENNTILGRHVGQLAPHAIENLNKLMKRYLQLKIVIISTWRISHTQAEIGEIFTQAGFKYSDRIIGMTPNLNGKRWVEICSWLVSHKRQIGGAVIIDDEIEVPKATKKYVVEPLYGPVETDLKLTLNSQGYLEGYDETKLGFNDEAYKKACEIIDMQMEE